MNDLEIRLRAEIRNLKNQHLETIKKNLALQIERDEWKKKFEELSVKRLKTVRIKVD